jgi:hypothetical protein
MRRINRPLLAALSLLLTVGITACSSESPTDVKAAPAGPHFEGGSTFGSGNFVSTDAPTTYDRVAADSGSAATTRAGVGFGSGN